MFFFICLFVFATATLQLSDTSLEAFLLYANHNDFQYAFNINTACCLVSRTTPQCTISEQGVNVNDAMKIKYDYTSDTLTFGKELPEGIYEVWIYQHKGKNLYSGLPSVEIDVRTEDGIIHNKYIVSNIVDTNNVKYAWWNVFTITKNSTAIVLEDYEKSKVSKDVFIQPPPSLIQVECEKVERDLNKTISITLMMVFTIIMLLL